MSASDLEPRQSGGATAGPVASIAGRSFEGHANDAPDPGRGLLERNAGPGTAPELASGGTANGRANQTGGGPIAD